MVIDVEKRMTARNSNLYERVLEVKRKKNVMIEKCIQTHQQSGIRKLNEGTNQNYHDWNNQKDMVL